MDKADRDAVTSELELLYRALETYQLMVQPYVDSSEMVRAAQRQIIIGLLKEIHRVMSIKSDPQLNADWRDPKTPPPAG